MNCVWFLPQSYWYFPHSCTSSLPETWQHSEIIFQCKHQEFKSLLIIQILVCDQRTEWWWMFLHKEEKLCKASHSTCVQLKICFRKERKCNKINNNEFFSWHIHGLPLFWWDLKNVMGQCNALWCLNPPSWGILVGMVQWPF